jgi:hypothetical protein
MNDSTNKSTKYFAIFATVVVVVIIIIAIIFILMYLTSTGVFKTTTSPFKSGFESGIKNLSGMDPLVRLEYEVGKLINMFDTQLNIDVLSAYQVFNEFLLTANKEIPMSVIEGATKIRESIIIAGNNLTASTNEYRKFVYELMQFRALLNDVFNSAYLLGNKVGGNDAHLEKLVNQRMAAQMDNVTLEWIKTIAPSEDEKDLREIALQSLAGADRDIGAADSYVETISSDRNYVTNALPPALTPGKNGKLPQYPYRGSRHNRGEIKDIDLDEIPPNEQKDRPAYNNAGIINTQRDHEIYNPFTDYGIRR